MSIRDESEQFGIVALSQNTITQSQQCIAGIDGKGVAIEGVDSGLTIAGSVAILYIVVDERSLVEAFDGHGSAMHIAGHLGLARKGLPDSTKQEGTPTFALAAHPVETDIECSIGS